MPPCIKNWAQGILGLQDCSINITNLIFGNHYHEKRSTLRRCNYVVHKKLSDKNSARIIFHYANSKGFKHILPLKFGWRTCFSNCWRSYHWSSGGAKNFFKGDQAIYIYIYTHTHMKNVYNFYFNMIISYLNKNIYIK